MTSPARAIRTLVLATLLVVVGLIVAAFIVRDFEIAPLLLIGASAVLLVASILSVMLRGRDDVVLRDASLTYYLQPPIVNAVLAGVYGAMAMGTVAVGIAFVSIDNIVGWGLILCGSAGLVLLTFEIWVARRPFGDLEQE
jgi:hypothetical protein